VIDDPATPIRRAALLLHAMAPVDRNWMLAQLPAAGRTRLETLLRDLAELGIPNDPTLLKQVATAGMPAAEPILARPVDEAGSEQPFAAVAAADPVRLAVVLRDEPVDLVAMLLAAGDWTWRDAFMRQIGPLKARQVAERLAARWRGCRPGSALERALLAAVARRLRAVPMDGMPREAVRRLPDAPLVKRIAWGRNWIGHLLGPLTRGQVR
jgi:hypothetical protein